MPRSDPALDHHLRVLQDGRRVFGPGKAELLHYIAATGSIRSAATEMHMSYQRAWNLVQEMNQAFTAPLVTVARGGGSRGGALLTPTGAAVLARYEGMGRASAAAVRADWAALRRLLK